VTANRFSIFSRMLQTITLIFFLGLLIFGPMILTFDDLQTVLVFRIIFSFVAIFCAVSAFGYWIRFQLRVRSDHLEIRRFGVWLLGRYCYRWNRDDISSIDVTETGTELNHQKQFQLSIKGKPSLKLLCTNWQANELAFIAEMLNHELNIPFKGGTFDSLKSTAKG